MNRMVIILAFLLSGWMAAPVTQAQTERERGLGPFTLVTTRGEITVRLLRRVRVPQLVAGPSHG